MNICISPTYCSFVFFFKQKTAYEMRISDWSSDVCSSDLDAELNAEKDKERRALVEAKNHAESLIHTTEKTLAEAGDKVPAADKTAAESAIADLKSAAEGDRKSVV